MPSFWKRFWFWHLLSEKKCNKFEFFSFTFFVKADFFQSDWMFLNRLFTLKKKAKNNGMDKKI